MQGSAAKRITCEFFPQWPLNPYQRLLTECLEENNVTVRAARQLKAVAAAIKGGEKPPDIIHLHAIPRFTLHPIELARNVVFYLRLWKIRKAGARIVWTIHDLYPHESKWGALDMRFSRSLVGRVDHCFVHGPAALRLVCQSWRLPSLPHATIIWHGHYSDVYPNHITREAARQNLGIKDSAFVFLFLGMIRPYKGIDVLIKAFAGVKEPDATLLVAGQPVDSDIRKAIELAAREDSRIKFLPGYSENRDIQTYMNAADIVVFPYRDSTLTSGAVIMAMGFRKPCIAPKLGAIEDVLDTDGALLIEEARVDTVRMALQTAYRERANLASMGAHNHAKCVQWSWDVIAKETAQVYRQCLGSSRTGATTVAPTLNSSNATRQDSFDPYALGTHTDTNALHR
jgi:beta-1,4-mannosyltransferase